MKFSPEFRFPSKVRAYRTDVLRRTIVGVKGRETTVSGFENVRKEEEREQSIAREVCSNSLEAERVESEYR